MTTYVSTEHQFETIGIVLCPSVFGDGWRANAYFQNDLGVEGNVATPQMQTAVSSIEFLVLMLGILRVKTEAIGISLYSGLKISTIQRDEAENAAKKLGYFYRGETK